ncbi:MAG: exo-alpha-sialidase [Candidatus Eisenbacteria bacterium]|nr:exo-alpha-sialidase [Candidatus Eisenbacteria bacterium]
MSSECGSLPAEKCAQVRRGKRAAAFCGLLIITLLAASCAGRGGLWRALDSGNEAGPPVLLAFEPDAGLFALTCENSGTALALWRADTSAIRRAAGGGGGISTAKIRWQRWSELDRCAPEGRLDVALSRNTIAVAGVDDQGVWIARHAADAPSQGTAPWGIAHLPAQQPVFALCMESQNAASRAEEWLHLVTFEGGPQDTLGRIVYRRSSDEGETWSAPFELACGALGKPGIAASDASSLVDVCYARDSLMVYRGSTDAGGEWSAEKVIRLRASPTGNAEIARAGPELFVLCENHLHQAAGSASENEGHNWEPAIALARQSAHARRPALDAAAGVFWAAFSQGDSLVALRSATHPRRPQAWLPPVSIDEACAGSPALQALPDGSAALLFARERGGVRFARIAAPRAEPDSAR